MDFNKDYLNKHFDFDKFASDCPVTALKINGAINRIKRELNNELIETIIERYSNEMNAKLRCGISNLKQKY